MGLQLAGDGGSTVDKDTLDYWMREMDVDKDRCVRVWLTANQSRAAVALAA